MHSLDGVGDYWSNSLNDWQTDLPVTKVVNSIKHGAPTSGYCARSRGGCVGKRTYSVVTNGSDSNKAKANEKRFKSNNGSDHSRSTEDDREQKPSYSYIGLIAKAILSRTDRRMILSDIYAWIQANYAYFHSRGPGWRNSIRHNLSLNDCFVKIGRASNGKGHYWTIHPANLHDFSVGDFRRRRAQRKVRQALGLAPLDLDDFDELASLPAAANYMSQSPTTRVEPKEYPALKRTDYSACCNYSTIVTHSNNRIERDPSMHIPPPPPMTQIISSDQPSIYISDQQTGTRPIGKSIHRQTKEFKYHTSPLHHGYINGDHEVLNLTNGQYQHANQLTDYTLTRSPDKTRSSLVTDDVVKQDTNHLKDNHALLLGAYYQRYYLYCYYYSLWFERSRRCSISPRCSSVSSSSLSTQSLEESSSPSRQKPEFDHQSNTKISLVEGVMDNIRQRTPSIPDFSVSNLL